MEKKKLIIVILGAKKIRPHYHWLKKAFIFLYNKLGLSALSSWQLEAKWKENFYSGDREVIYLHWGRGISSLSRFLALRKLKKIIKEYQNTHDIYLIGHSLGGEVALEACNIFDGIIKKAILVFSVNQRKNIKIKKTKIVNIYSPVDFFVQTVIRVLAPLTGNQKLIGNNIANISLNEFRHEELFSNKKISGGKFNGKTVPQMINDLI